MPKRRRFATRNELVELLAPYLSGLDERHPDGDYKWTDVAATALDALSEMQVPIDALVEITADEGG
jgi:hypothetical protein